MTFYLSTWGSQEEPGGDRNPLAGHLRLLYPVCFLFVSLCDKSWEVLEGLFSLIFSSFCSFVYDQLITTLQNITDTLLIII